VQFYTSGTTGLPKGAELTNANFAACCRLWTEDVAAGAGRAQPRLPADVPYRRRRLGHRRAVRRRHQPRHARVRAAQILDTIERERLQVMLLVPAMILFLVQAPQIRETDLSSLRLIVYGASPIPAELLQAGDDDLSLRLPAGLWPDRDDRRDHPAAAEDHDPNDARKLLSCGYAQKDVELRIVGDDGKDLRAGQVGEIAVRSPQVMGGYWKLPEATARAIQGDWFFTGDAGYLDDKGYLYIYDRVKDMIVSGGENIYPPRSRARCSAIPPSPTSP
jgi:acyl-CoA synthetase (AMP-forming)/AMP-acid ligase II